MNDFDNKEFKQRMLEIQGKFAKSVSDFARQVGMNQQTVNNYLMGARDVSLEVVWRVAKTYPQISADWLLTGEGTMHREKQEEGARNAAIAAENDRENRELREENMALVAQVAKLQEQHSDLLNKYHEMVQKCLNLMEGKGLS